MTMADDWDFNYAGKTISHIDGKLSYDGGIASLVNAAKHYNANTLVYTDETTDINNATANDVLLPPTQVVAVGDIIYLGGGTKFGAIRLNVGTAGVYSGITLQWQYWNGVWVALPGITDGTSFFTVGGINNITFTPPADWALTTIQTFSRYWIRAIATTAPTVITTAPLGTQG